MVKLIRWLSTKGSQIRKVAIRAAAIILGQLTGKASADSPRQEPAGQRARAKPGQAAVQKRPLTPPPSEPMPVLPLLEALQQCVAAALRTDRAA
jgi:hypothetical protein